MAVEAVAVEEASPTSARGGERAFLAADAVAAEETFPASGFCLSVFVCFFLWSADAVAADEPFPVGAGWRRAVVFGFFCSCLFVIVLLLLL